MEVFQNQNNPLCVSNGFLHIAQNKPHLLNLKLGHSLLLERKDTLSKQGAASDSIGLLQGKNTLPMLCNCFYPLDH